MLIRKQLRGIGRFGYRVSKENFLFLDLDNPSMSNPDASGVFRCAGGMVVTLHCTMLKNRYEQIVSLRLRFGRCMPRMHPARPY